MPKFGQIVLGPAGVGKSTFCQVIQEHCLSAKRTVHLVNLDPAAESLCYDPSIDIRDLISLKDPMECMDFGPNGGLVFCMEFLIENLEWLKDKLSDYGDDEYLLFDCPGQIELFSHLPVMQTLVKNLQQWDFRLCAVYLIDAVCASDTTKLVAGTMMALSAMVKLELPHINVLSKCDLDPSRSTEEILTPTALEITSDLDERLHPKWKKFNASVAALIDDMSLVAFVPLDPKDEESISFVMAHIDRAIQYGEDLDVAEIMEMEEED